MGCIECGPIDHCCDVPELVSSSNEEEAVEVIWKNVEKKKKHKRVWIQREEGKVEKEGICMILNFQVADAKKPLMSVKRVAEKGNKACVGPGEEDNYINV